jgi:glutamate synthase (NADPH/NADH) small chain
MNSQPVAIGYLERFAADYERNVSKDVHTDVTLQRSAVDAASVEGKSTVPTLAKTNRVKIAVAGSGPAGLSFAGDMAKAGYQVTVFEALHEIGGVLKYGIPAFRLPNYIVDVEVETLKQMGVTFVTNCIIGKTISYEQLLADGFQGIFVATGAGLPNFMHIKGENLNGVLSSNEYLTRVNLMNANHPMADTPVFRGKHVAVIGGGNTAMDSVRTAKRLGAATAMIVYRRSENEMPARIEEIKHAKEEGVIFMNLYNPMEYEGDQYGHVNKMFLQRMQLGEPDSSGRRKPEIIPGSIEIIEVDMVVVAVGVSPNPLIPNTFKGLDVSSRGTVIIQQDTLRTSLHNVYAGGDIVHGGATVILAMGDGRKAAEAMKKALEK